MNQPFPSRPFPTLLNELPVLRSAAWLAGWFLILSGCHFKRPYRYEDDHYLVTQVGSLPKLVDESSGLALTSDTNSFWTLNDGGGKNELYRISRQGKLLSTWELPGTQNIDWEELAKDSLGNLYVGDVGNNWHLRRDLKIYRVAPDPTARISFINFRYADQQGFPPAFTPRNFDCEAFFWYRDSLYLFSKNWSGLAEKLYVLPATPGDYVAQLKDTFTLDQKARMRHKRDLVTSADISTDGKTFALLTYGKVFLFDVIHGTIGFQRPSARLVMNPDAVGQTEALAFINATDFVFTNEEGSIFLARRKPQ